MLLTSKELYDLIKDGKLELNEFINENYKRESQIVNALFAQTAAKQDEKLHKAMQLLDEVSASLETCLTHYCHDMPPDDARNRAAACATARTLCAEFFSTTEKA